MKFFLSGAELSLNSVINHINWPQFKDLVSHMCLSGTIIASWCLTQVVTGSSTFNVKLFCQWIQQIQWKHLGKTPLGWHYRKCLCKLQSKIGRKLLQEFNIFLFFFIKPGKCSLNYKFLVSLLLQCLFEETPGKATNKSI